jgi:hypothetical protein
MEKMLKQIDPKCGTCDLSLKAIYSFNGGIGTPVKNVNSDNCPLCSSLVKTEKGRVLICPRCNKKYAACWVSECKCF